jgi:uncharacterized repeat protein (TIGR01451 family)
MEYNAICQHHLFRPVQCGGMPSLPGSRGKSAGLLIFLLVVAALFLKPLPSFAADPVAGIDCSCTKTGDYVAQHQGVIPAVNMVTVNEGLSPNSLYRIVTAQSSLNIYKNETNGALMLSITGIPAGAGWGFSPDDHRFVYHYITAGQQTLELYDLSQTTGQPAGTISRTVASGESSRIRFSAKGIYLFYLAVRPNGQNDVSVMDVTGTLVHTSTYTHAQGVGLEGDKFSNSTWGFSRDDRDRTMVYAWNTGQSSIQVMIVNLAEKQTVADLSFPAVYSSFWRFSRCGDVIGLYIQEAGVVSSTTPNPVRIRLHSTLKDQTLFHNTFSAIDYTVFSCDNSTHRVAIGTTTWDLAPNTASTGCPVAPVPETKLESLALSAPGVTGGEKVTGTVSLTLAAPQGGFTVNLSSNRAEATVPSNVVVAAGKKTADFEIQTVPVAGSVTATIKASAGGIEKTRSLTIGSPRLIGISLDDDSLYGGNPTMLRLQLDGNVPSGGVEIALQTDGGDELELPATARIWSGKTGSVWLETRGVASPVDISISGTLIQERSVTLHLMPAEVEEIVIDYEVFSPCVLQWSDQQVIGGRQIGFRVRLNGEAPPAGALIQLSSNDPSRLAAPGSVVVGGLERSAVFQATSAPVTGSRSVTLTTTYLQKSVNRSLTLIKPPVRYIVQEITLPNSPSFSPVAMNETGQVLLYSWSDDNYYLWENGNVTRLNFPVPDGMRATVVGLNDNGQFVGTLREIIYDRGGAVWKNGVRTDLRIPYRADNVYIAAINNRGQVAGSYVIRDGLKSHRAVVRWTGDQPTELTSPDHLLAPNYILIPHDINESGKVSTSGWRTTQNYYLPYYISTLHDRNYLRFSRADGYHMGNTYVNNHNTFTGGSTQIFRTDESGFTAVTPPQQGYGQSSGGINDHEEIAGYATHLFEAEGYEIKQAVRVTEQGTWPLECMVADMAAGLVLQEAVAISNAGQILVSSQIRDENDNYDFFTWLLTPEDAPRANLRLQKSVDAAIVETGDLITYTIAANNQGPDEALLVRLSGMIAENQFLISAEPDRGSCNIIDGNLVCELGNLASGASANVVVTTRAMVSGLSPSQAVVTSSTLETDPSSNRAVAIVTVQGGEPVQKSADLGAGQTGPVDLADAGATIDVTEGSNTSGSVSITMYHEEPENSQDLPLISVQSFGGPSEPDSVLIERFWTIEPESLEGLTYTLCLNVSGLCGVNPNFLVITKRPDSSEPWAVHNSYLQTVDNALFLCAAGLTGFSDLGIATEKGKYVPPQEPLMQLPGEVMLIDPADGLSLERGEVSFSWHAAFPDVSGYGFELSADTEFSVMIIDSLTSGTEIQVADPGGQDNFWWRVRAQNPSGWGPYSTVRHMKLVVTDAGKVTGIPAQYELYPNYPNPFSRYTRIRFALPEPSAVRIEVFNLFGRKVAAISEGELGTGWHEITFDGSALPAGIYVFRLQAGTFRETRKMMIVK